MAGRLAHGTKFSHLQPISGAGKFIAGAGMVVAAALQVAWGRARCGLALSWGCLWFAAALAPETGVLMPINALLLEHWMYLPTIGIALGCAQTIADMAETAVEKNAYVRCYSDYPACIGVWFQNVSAE